MRWGIVFLVACSSSPDGNGPVDSSPMPDDRMPDTGGQLPAYTVVNKFGHDLIRSVTVHKNGGENRIVYVEAARVANVTTANPLVDNTRLILEVTGGGCFVIEKMAGAWQYGSFGCASNPAVFTVSPMAGCNGCHGGSIEPGVFTAPSLRRLITTHVGEDINCPMGPGPNPCAPSVYQ